MEYRPDWRFGQFIYNFIVWLNSRKSIDPFFPEEDEMIELLKEFVDEKKLAQFVYPCGSGYGVISIRAKNKSSFSS